MMKSIFKVVFVLSLVLVVSILHSCITPSTAQQNAVGNITKNSKNSFLDDMERLFNADKEYLKKLYDEILRNNNASLNALGNLGIIAIPALLNISKIKGHPLEKHARQQALSNFTNYITESVSCKIISERLEKINPKEPFIELDISINNCYLNEVILKISEMYKVGMVYVHCKPDPKLSLDIKNATFQNAIEAVLLKCNGLSVMNINSYYIVGNANIISCLSERDEFNIQENHYGLQGKMEFRRLPIGGFLFILEREGYKILLNMEPYSDTYVSMMFHKSKIPQKNIRFAELTPILLLFWEHKFIKNGDFLELAQLDMDAIWEKMMLKHVAIKHMIRLWNCMPDNKK